jgi:putative nucleotidyltransferase with HDIG domain
LAQLTFKHPDCLDQQFSTLPERPAVNPARAQDIRNRLLVARMPSPPQTLLKLLSLCQSDEADIDELAELMARDPALSAKVLAVAHSAAYHRADAQPLNLLQATSRLGTALIKVLVISELVFQTFSHFKQASEAHLQNFWKHSLCVALIAKELAHRLGYAPVEEAYLAGLLHDIGRLALLAAAPEHCHDLFANDDNQSMCAQEQQNLEMSHAEAGAWLLGRWRLSEHLIESVLLHHEIDSRLKQAHALTRLIHLAHRLSEIALGDDPAASALVDEQGLSAADLLTISQQAVTQVEQVARDLGIDISKALQPKAVAASTSPAPFADTVQMQLVQEVLDRSVLNEMVMTLIAAPSSESALTQLRQHASALLHLEDMVVMLLRSNQQQMVPASMNESHNAAAQLSYDVTKDSWVAECIAGRKIVFTKRTQGGATTLLDLLTTDELVLIPLLSARHCLGVLVAAVPSELSRHLKTRVDTLHSFGTYAGLALARRRQANMSTSALITITKQEQQLELRKMLLESSKLVKGGVGGAGSSVDLTTAVKDMLQQLEEKELVPGNIKLTSQLAERSSMVRGSLGLVQQVFLILINHAFERLPKGGDVVVSAGSLAHRHGAMYVNLSVSDSAPGSTQTIQAQLFEPPHIIGNGQAPGLDLCDMNQLVEKMAGHLNFTAGPSGTRFDILFPCARQMQLAA